MSSFKVGHSYYPKVAGLPNHVVKKNQPTENKGTFASQLQKTMLEQHTLQKPQIKFSHHAKVRLQERGIDLSTEQMDRLYSGVEKARQKGANESLLLMEGMAFVVSVKNETVITAMDQDLMAEQVITNIDSAVLL